MQQSDAQRERVLILGNSQTEEMRGVMHSLQEVFDAAELECVPRLSELKTESVQPELVVICQNWPDEFAGRTLTELVRRFPVSRFLCCYGVWCEADGRTRNFWPVSIRVPARAAEFRIRQEAEIIRGTAPAYPLTAGRDEIFHYQAASESDPEGDCLQGKRVGVISGDPVYRRMLEALVQSRGALIASAARRAQADLWLYDLDPWDVVQSRLMLLGEHPVCIGMMGLAHPETITAARLLGVDAVVCKVAPEQELFQTISRTLQEAMIHPADY